MLPGTEIHTELHSTDAHSGIPLVIRESGNPGSLTLGARDMIGITDFSFVSVVGGDCKIESVNGAGTLTLFRGSLTTNALVVQHLHTPFWGLRGGTLLLTAAAGVIDFAAQGFYQQGT